MKKNVYVFWLLIVLMLIPTNVLAIEQNPTANSEGAGVKNDLFYAVDGIDINGIPNETELANIAEQNKELMKEQEFATQGKKVGKGKGELYKAYKDDIKKLKDTMDKNQYNNMVDTIKNYNTATGELDCGTFDFGCKVKGLLISGGSDFLDIVINPLQNFIIKPSDVLNAPSVSGFKNAFTSLTDVAVVLFFIYQILKIISMRMTNGEGISQGVFEKTAKLIVSVCIIGVYEPLFKIALSVEYLLVSPILSTVTLSETGADALILRMMLLNSGVGTALLILGLGMIYLVITISLFYRLAMMILLYIVGPFAIASMVNDEMDFFTLWIRKLVANILTITLQALCIAMSIRIGFRVNFDEATNVTDVCLSAAFMFLALGVPKLLENFGNSTGASRASISAVQTSTNLVRTLKR
ncbi:conjugal transfer protein TrbL family protein [Macrococcoides canis]|uniref:conjugal transfer protein TrbL family protein n=1 Tax=Macrococcoides canis TaxID=1855823 RepID=UPI00165D8389|nr:conjugal transfer protein TrbL family protein [Macrococcus canis]QNR09085.1 hypothetical protein GL258_12430 [Macrococcus canis]